MKLDRYNSFVFDCDGVLLDSNTIKSDAFFQAALPYGEEAAKALVEYHKAHGGVSRFVKFEYLFKTLLGCSDYEADLKAALENYGDIVRQKLFECRETPGMRDFLKALPKEALKIVVSGGMQSELREVFEQRQLAGFFDAIYGSPDTKAQILQREIETGRLRTPAVFFGDSRLDYEVAAQFGMDFVFVVDHTEFTDWEIFFTDKPVTIAAHLGDLIKEI
ncbi:MAG: HAD family hydrolase [Campylobacterales bacterium]